MQSDLCPSMAHPYFDIEIVDVRIRLRPDYVTLSQMHKISMLQKFLEDSNFSFNYEIFT